MQLLLGLLTLTLALIVFGHHHISTLREMQMIKNDTQKFYQESQKLLTDRYRFAKSANHQEGQAMLGILLFSLCSVLLLQLLYVSIIHHRQFLKSRSDQLLCLDRFTRQTNTFWTKIQRINKSILALNALALTNPSLQSSIGILTTIQDSLLMKHRLQLWANRCGPINGQPGNIPFEISGLGFLRSKTLVTIKRPLPPFIFALKSFGPAPHWWLPKVIALKLNISGPALYWSLS